MKILVTGGAGFIGSALVRHLVLEAGHQVCTLDKLSYSGNLANLIAVDGLDGHQFVQLDICEAPALRSLVFDYAPDAIMHLAAESHVDRSIDDPREFVQANVVGTFNLLEVARAYLSQQPELRLLHVSTDEVFGSLPADGLFSEDTPYRPTSPYSATKAASDHLVRAWFHTYDLPILITNCSNNYGPYQHPEKLIPLVIARALAGEQIPVYGNGQQIRDWLFVDDHVRGLVAVLEQGRTGETYNIGGASERTNLEVVEAILACVATCENINLQTLHNLITFVTDRPGHDRRYAVDTTKIRRELNWQPSVTFADGISRTLDWYATHPDWCAAVGQTYAGERLGLSQALAK